MILLGVLLFLYIYNVPIIPINTTHILAIGSIIYLLIYYKEKLKDLKNNYQILLEKIKDLKSNYKQILKQIKNYKIHILTVSIMMSIVYILLMYGINKFIFAYIIVLENIPIIFAIYIYSKDKGIKIEGILNILIIISVVQGTLAFLAYFIKPIQHLFVNLLIMNTGDDPSIIQMMAAVRLYGFSSNLTFSTPIIQVIMAFISLQMFINKKEKKYLFIIPLLIFSAIINARISIVIMAFGMIAIFIANINKNNYKKLCTLAAILSIIVCITIGVLLNIQTNNTTISRITTAIEEILAFFSGKKIGYFDAVFNQFIDPPTGWDFIIGTGKNMIGNSSDVGYINDLHMGGIILCILLYPGYIYMVLSIKSTDKKTTKLLRILGMLSFIAMNIKWVATQPNNVLNMYMLLYIISNLKESEKN